MKFLQKINSGWVLIAWLLLIVYAGLSYWPLPDSSKINLKKVQEEKEIAQLKFDSLALVIEHKDSLIMIMQDSLKNTLLLFQQMDSNYTKIISRKNEVHEFVRSLDANGYVRVLSDYAARHKGNDN